MVAHSALGLRTHSGWAVVVVVSGSLAKPVVQARRRIVTADPAIPGSKQPYHAAEALPLQEAEDLIRRCHDRSITMATTAIEQFMGEYSIVAAGILSGSGRQLPELGAILKSHTLLHTAEGEFFREVAARACASRGLPVTRYSERNLLEHGCAIFRLDAAQLRQRITAIGKPLGPPWREDEKLAALAAWISLESSTIDPERP